MNIKRIVKHILATDGQVNRAFPPSALIAIDKAIEASESTHVGEIRFAVEAALDGSPLFKGQTARSRAIDLFSQLRVWDTQHNTGVLIYLLMADRAVEIIADRGINAKVDTQEWCSVCREMETAFGLSNFEGGVVGGVQAVTQRLVLHFPAQGHNRNELPNQPVVL